MTGILAERQGGRLIAVVGPSGAGKDSLISHARQRLAGSDHHRFVRRLITRPADAGGEDHIAIDRDELSDLEARGELALSWTAHGLAYGIPASTLRDLADGRILIVNGSRSALPLFRKCYGSALRTVLVTAPREILAKRLSARGRESIESVELRLARSGAFTLDDEADCTIVNDRTIEEGGRELVEFITSCDCRQTL